MDQVKRQNKSSLRQRQAEATRSLIIEAGQELFLKHGYSSTTIEAIAAQAGVAVSTVYAVFGSKRGILRGIRQAWHGRTHVQEIVYGDRGELSPEQRLEQLALASRRQWEMGWEVTAIYTGAAAADAEAAAELAEALAGRRKAFQAFALSLEGDLRPGLSVEQAIDILLALCLPEVYDQLVRRSGWSAEAYQSWLAQALKRELL